ncbi:hypothetical protein DID77_00160 [Candidatus Marinamargulisbacteria bacterium SCGC AG-439-L15]|nr:hypothetical protein DID77_00160 [Candidatus Marinamargulisbacteria bacterium SCGC AG-439-L15]
MRPRDFVKIVKEAQQKDLTSSPNLETKNDKGETIFHLLAKKGAFSEMSQLRAADKYVSIDNDNKTPLHHAIEKGCDLRGIELKNYLPAVCSPQTVRAFEKSLDDSSLPHDDRMFVAQELRAAGINIFPKCIFDEIIKTGNFLIGFSGNFEIISDSSLKTNFGTLSETDKAKIEGYIMTLGSHDEQVEATAQFRLKGIDVLPKEILQGYSKGPDGKVIVSGNIQASVDDVTQKQLGLIESYSGGGDPSKIETCLEAISDMQIKGSLTKQLRAKNINVLPGGLLLDSKINMASKIALITALPVLTDATADPTEKATAIADLETQIEGLGTQIERGNLTFKLRKAGVNVLPIEVFNENRPEHKAKLLAALPGLKTDDEQIRTLTTKFASELKEDGYKLTRALREEGVNVLPDSLFTEYASQLTLFYEAADPATKDAAQASLDKIVGAFSALPALQSGAADAAKAAAIAKLEGKLDAFAAAGNGITDTIELTDALRKEGIDVLPDSLFDAAVDIDERAGAIAALPALQSTADVAAQAAAIAKLEGKLDAFAAAAADDAADHNAYDLTYELREKGLDVLPLDLLSEYATNAQVALITALPALQSTADVAAKATAIATLEGKLDAFAAAADNLDAAYDLTYELRESGIDVLPKSLFTEYASQLTALDAADADAQAAANASLDKIVSAFFALTFETVKATAIATARATITTAQADLAAAQGAVAAAQAAFDATKAAAIATAKATITTAKDDAINKLKTKIDKLYSGNPAAAITLTNDLLSKELNVLPGSLFTEYASQLNVLKDTAANPEAKKVAIAEIEAKIDEFPDAVPFVAIALTNALRESGIDVLPDSLFDDPIDIYAVSGALSVLPALRSANPEAKKVAIANLEDKILSMKDPVAMQALKDALNTSSVDVFNTPDRQQKFLVHKTFQEIKDPTDKQTVHSDNGDNKSKNRYRNIQAYDHSRVVLTRPAGSTETDYINANKVKMGSTKKCIATQGPNPKTIDDFWQMAWQENTQSIAMVTNLVEGPQTKCEAYAPGLDKASLGTDVSTETYGDIKVTCKSIVTEGSVVTRSYELTKGTETRTLTHTQFVGWPDHGTPGSVGDYLKFVEKVRTVAKEGPSSPDIVHCSAGVGRTGTFIMTNILLDQLERSGDEYGKLTLAHDNEKLLTEMTDEEMLAYLKDNINILRQDRNLLVQTRDQLEFLFEVMKVKQSVLKEISDNPNLKSTDSVAKKAAIATLEAKLDAAGNGIADAIDLTNDLRRQGIDVFPKQLITTAASDSTKIGLIAGALSALPALTDPAEKAAAIANLKDKINSLNDSVKSDLISKLKEEEITIS